MKLYSFCLHRESTDSLVISACEPIWENECSQPLQLVASLLTLLFKKFFFFLFEVHTMLLSHVLHGVREKGGLIVEYY